MLNKEFGVTSFYVGGELFMDNMIIETRFEKMRNRKKLKLVVLESIRRRW